MAEDTDKVIVVNGSPLPPLKIVAAPGEWLFDELTHALTTRQPIAISGLFRISGAISENGVVTFDLQPTDIWSTGGHGLRASLA